MILNCETKSSNTTTFFNVEYRIYIRSLSNMSTAALAAGWVPFAIAVCLILLFSFVYIRYFQHRYDSEICSTVACILGLSVALTTIAIVPVDIFLISFMKNPDGTFKDWASTPEGRQNVENSVLNAYYALYIIQLIFVFIILPFAYFYYEEVDEEVPVSKRVCTAVKFTAVFLVAAVVLTLTGLFLPFRTPEQSNMTITNSSEWDKFKFIFSELGNNHGEDTLSFIIGALTVLGFLFAILYTAYGMSAWPMDLIKGRRSATTERLEVLADREQNEARVRAIRDKYRDQRQMSTRDRRRVEDLEQQVSTMSRRERHLEVAERSWARKCGKVFWPIQIALGFLCFLLALLVFISLLLTNIDKLLHSLGPSIGYTLPKQHLPNPIDIALVFSQKVFPLDYIIMALVILYFFFSSMGGLQHIGIWFCCIRMYKVRVRRTKPQGLLFLVFLLMFIVLALNVIIYELTPQYTTYGNQHYMHHENATMNGPGKLTPCTTDAPPGDCIMSRLSLLLTRFFYKAGFFGVAYFWLTWVFLLVVLLSFVIVLIRKRRSSIEGEVDPDDFDDSDDELIRA